MGKGRTVRQIHHFLDGEWGPDMDSRADLEKAVNSCRTLKNFQIDQYGEAIRRRGLQYVGGVLGECLSIDPLRSFPDWENLEDAEIIDPPVDQYGSLGPSEARHEDHASDWWLVCDWLVHCFGPTDEGVPMVNNYDRYMTRWRAKLEDGVIYYGKVGDPYVQVGADLYPDVLTDAIGLGFAFDANAKPVFATQIGNDIEIRRYVADVPTTYTFGGLGPRLFFNGTLQPSNSLWDVVCYYCESGDLKARFQRDNFNTAYTLYSNVDNYLIRVKHTDEGIGDLIGRHCIAASGNNDVREMFVTGTYDAWPIYGSDSASVSTVINSDIDYNHYIVATSESDSASVSATINSDILYSPIAVTHSESESATSLAQINSDILYELSAISHSESESAQTNVEINSDIVYDIQAISITESEAANAGVVINSDIDYTI